MKFEFKFKFRFVFGPIYIEPSDKINEIYAQDRDRGQFN